jgi:hypothetical protein
MSTHKSKKAKISSMAPKKISDSADRLGFVYKPVEVTVTTTKKRAVFNGVLTKLFTEEGKRLYYVGMCDLDHQPTEWHPKSYDRSIMPWNNNVRGSIKDPERFSSQKFFEQSKVRMLVVVNGGFDEHGTGDFKLSPVDDFDDSYYDLVEVTEVVAELNGKGHSLMLHFTGKQEPLATISASSLKIRENPSSETVDLNRPDKKDWKVIMHPIIEVGFVPDPLFPGEEIKSFKDDELVKACMAKTVMIPKFHNQPQDTMMCDDDYDWLHSGPALYAPFKYFDYKSQELKEMFVWVCPAAMEPHRPNYDMDITMPCDVLKLKLGFKVESNDSFMWSSKDFDKMESDGEDY